MTNPFDNEEATFLVLVNDEGQYSLWPAFAEIPEGWASEHGEATRQECLAFIDKYWTDMRPTSLLAETGRSDTTAP
ncbi:MAG: MbtH family protein [Streptomyces sp.]|jgi:MbtH protein|nr:MbtH family protein [Streptomyces sp.]